MEKGLQGRPALLLVDMQKGFEEKDYYGGERNNPRAEQQAQKLLAHWRSRGLPLFHIQYSSHNPGSPLRPDLPGFAFKDEVAPLPGEPVLVRSVNSAFIGTDLQARLDAQGIDTVVVTGLATEHCVSTTTRMAANLGYRTFIIADATAAFNKTGINGEHMSAELVHQVSLATLQGEFATVLTTQELLSRLEAPVPAPGN
ncbi:cysteine hydrolase family protein [Chitinophaga japonensis]|uniref:Nicotinamidase-related amidase n=1 Tax=Chitinophaga japonensis TaxID=104662 RepID=A0A562T067_CHIJA|nr:cysteine hydrolase family protein [Chitinophaga japonensis]TWI86654.1 nicotinamidase-related amidase [Chitinophaga japonensis]